MKKMLLCILCVVFMFSLLACGNHSGSGATAENTTGSDTQPVLQDGQVLAGFGRIDLSPSGNGFSLVGYGGNGTPDTPMQGTLDHIYGTCIALTDAEDNTALIYTVDTLYTVEAEVNMLRTAITEKTGVPGENIVISGTHTHSSLRYASIRNYAELMTQAAVDAMADRSPASILTGSADIENMNFVRHYTTQNGIVVGDNFSKAVTADNPRTGHITQADPQMRLIRFVRDAEDKKDILMCNWQAHAKVASTSETEFGKAHRPMLSADFIGWCRTYVEKETDCLFAYYSGASGNLNPISKMPDLRQKVSEKVDVYGSELGARVVATLDSLVPAQGGKVATYQQRFQVQAVGNGVPAMELTAIRVGEVGFAAVPFEMFDTNGKQLRNESNCTTTFVMTCASMGVHEYIPSEYMWDYDTGEEFAYELLSCKHERGTAEKVASELASMLNGLTG